jgi:hypothetical protein
MRKWISYLLPIIGLAIFVFIIRNTGIGQIRSTFDGIEPIDLLLFPVFTAAIILIRGYRWQYLMRLVGIRYSMARSGAVWTIGFFAAAITPGKVGDAVRAFYVSQETGRNVGECFLTVFIDRLMDLVTVVLFGIVTILLFSYQYIRIPSIWVILLASLGGLFLIFLLLNRNVTKTLVRPVFTVFFPKKYKETLSMSFNSFYDSLALYVREWKGTLKAFLLTVGYWVLVFGLAWYVAFIMGIEVSFYYIVIIMPIVTLVELIPISVSGLGTREATVIYFFSVIGIASAEAVGFSIVYLIVGTYITSVIGLLFWLRNPVKLSG